MVKLCAFETGMRLEWLGLVRGWTMQLRPNHRTCVPVLDIPPPSPLLVSILLKIQIFPSVDTSVFPNIVTMSLIVHIFFQV